MKRKHVVILLFLLLLFSGTMAASTLPEPASSFDVYEFWSIVGAGYGPRLKTNVDPAIGEDSRLDGWGLSLSAQGFGRQYGWGYFVRNDILFSVSTQENLGVFMMFSGGPLYSFYLAPEADAFLGGGFGMTIASLPISDDASSLNLGFAMEGGIRYALYSPQLNRRSIGIVLGVAAQCTLLTLRENSLGKDVAISAPTLYAVPYIGFAFNFDGVPGSTVYSGYRSLGIYF
ncbi:hypothetical protein [Parasphaerochaeta coccoides]|uniref:Outer membrane protein beta-barrel domain-containing protein n=1 Tax=Parasphaerochaeta coccoides (strain ATCC BAA-1237 / DSM 17374 / SPN1) TaxID=760011 RepID=F4GM36_PARC1|nr:hypothetical protein [Parasphaerochaeta coccoides]AEC02511.1 hypothetical protein Spico_1303 [Parasphaerochaeta coccoides DSM 17374]